MLIELNRLEIALTDTTITKLIIFWERPIAAVYENCACCKPKLYTYTPIVFEVPMFPAVCSRSVFCILPAMI